MDVELPDMRTMRLVMAVAVGDSMVEIPATVTEWPEGNGGSAGETIDI
jgi:hypothetical protein